MSDQENDLPVEETGTPVEEQVALPEDPVKNLKSEVSRKFDNLNSQFAALNQSLQQLAAERAPRQPTQEKPLRELMYDDPDAAAELITQRAVQRADEIITSKNERQQAMQGRINELTNQYPEFAQGNGEATLTAQRIHSTLPKNLQNTAEGAELAIQRAAMELGLVPVSRRRKPVGADDGYIPPSSGSPRGRAPSKDREMTDEEFTFAYLLNESIGRNFNDEKVQKNLKKYSQRKTWNKYGTGDES